VETTDGSMMAPDMTAVITARYTEVPIRVDGLLAEEAWKTANVYRLSLDKTRPAGERAPLEGGEVRVLWDDKNLYVGIRFQDSDIVAEGEEDQLHHYALGDLVELFLKPAGETWYWELYATPRGNKTSFWFPGRGRLGLDSAYDYRCGLRAAAQVKGTLNRWEDKDRYWTAEMAMPVADLTARGEPFGPGSEWRILVARYNYSRYLPWKELSMVPALSQTNYHFTHEYARLRFIK
jgi:hypothetical protein